MPEKQNNDFKKKLSKGFFDKGYSIRYDKWVEDPFTAFVERRQKKAFLELTNAKPNFKILDIGAGTGKYEFLYSQKIKNSGFIVALDFSDSMLEKISGNIKKWGLKHKVFIVKGDAENLPFKKEVFDEVLAMNTLQYLPNDNRFFGEVSFVLKKNGFALIDALSIAELRLGHNLTIVSDKLRKFFNKKQLGVYKQFYTVGSIKKKMNEFSLKVLDSTGVIFCLPWLTKEHIGITLPSPQHLILFFPGLYPKVEWLEDKLKRMPVLNNLCTHLMIKAKKV